MLTRTGRIAPSAVHAERCAPPRGQPEFRSAMTERRRSCTPVRSAGKELQPATSSGQQATSKSASSMPVHSASVSTESAPVAPWQVRSSMASTGPLVE